MNGVAIRAEPSTGPERIEGLLKPVDYSRRTRYRQPPDLYLRFKWLGPFLTALGISPSYVVTLEVPGRRSGVIRRTTLVETSSDGEEYLVALAGESEWVRNVRAAEGRVVIGRQERVAARLVEVPPEKRAPVIRAYLLRAGRGADSKAGANEARYYFGVNPNPSVDEIERIVQHYPVFKIVREGQGPLGSRSSEAPPRASARSQRPASGKPTEIAPACSGCRRAG